MRMPKVGEVWTFHRTYGEPSDYEITKIYTDEAGTKRASIMDLRDGDGRISEKYFWDHFAACENGKRKWRPAVLEERNEGTMQEVTQEVIEI